MSALFRFVDWPLRVKMAALLAAVSLLPLLITAWLDLREARERLLADMQLRLRVHAEQIARELDGVNAQNRLRVASLAHFPDVLAYCDADEADRARFGAEARGVLAVPPGNDPSVRAAALLDPTGRVRLSTDAAMLGLDLSSQPALQAALQGAVATSEVFVGGSSLDPEPTLAFLAPVQQADGRVACIAMLWVRASALSSALNAPNAPGGAGARALLFDALGIRIGPVDDGAGLFRPSGRINPLTAASLIAQRRFGERTTALLAELQPYPAVHERARAAAPDEALFTAFDPIDRVSGFGVARRLDSLPWTVFCFVPEAAYLAELERLRSQKLLLAIGAIVAASAVGVLFARGIAAPVGKLVTTTRAIAGGDLGARVRERRRDELGELARSIDTMADRVQTQARGLSQARDALDERVRERTAELEAEASERRAAEAAIRQSQRMLQAIIDNTSAVIYVKDLAGHYMLANRRFLDVFRLNDAMMLGQTDHEIFPREVADAFRAADQRVAMSGETLVIEESAPHEDGPHTYLSVKCPLPGEQGQFYGTFGISTDITDRKSIESSLQSQLERLQLLDQISTAIAEQQQLTSIYEVVLDHLEERMPVDFGCICLVDALHDSLVVARVGTRSERLAAQLGLNEQTRVEIGGNGLGRAVRGVLVHEPELRGQGSPLLLRFAGAKLRSLVIAPLQSESRVFGLLLVARNRPHSFSSADSQFLRQLSAHVALAAKQLQLHGALQQAYDDLRQTQRTVMQQERLRALGQMASGIAHDINNAISPVALYAETLLEREPLLSERGRGYLLTIARAIDDVAATVARMREFYRQREEPQALVPVALNPIVQQVIDLTHARWSDMPQQRGIVIHLHTELAHTLPDVLGIDNELREALINLVLNAVDAMPDGGTLTLRSRCEPMPDAIDPAARRVCIEVGDTGLGMGENTELHCLDPFFTTKGERGTGLGLAMVYGVTQRHRATIEIDTAPGRGTTVRLNFPVPAAHELPEAATVPAAHAPAPCLHVLVIDDDPLMLKSLGDTLELDGHHVVAASGGQRGIEAFRSHAEGQPFDLVITDLGMPYMDGRKVARAIKELGPHTPVIMLTGWGQRLLAEGEVPPHVDRLMSKPVRLEQLRAALAQLARAVEPASPPEEP